MIADKTILQPVADYLKNELQNELIRQGHSATGELTNSIQVVVNDIVGGFDIVGSSVYYGEFVERGRRKGAKGVPISALMKWIGVRNISIPGKSDLSVAFMFQNSIKNRGIKPSLFVEKTLSKYESKMQSDIERLMYQHVLTLVENMVTKTLTAVK